MSETWYEKLYNDGKETLRGWKEPDPEDGYMSRPAVGADGKAIQYEKGKELYQVVTEWDNTKRPAEPKTWSNPINSAQVRHYKFKWNLKILRPQFEHYEVALKGYKDLKDTLAKLKNKKNNDWQAAEKGVSGARARTELLRKTYQIEYGNKEYSPEAKSAKAEIDRLEATQPKSSSLDSFLMVANYPQYSYEEVLVPEKFIRKKSDGTKDEITVNVKKWKWVNTLFTGPIDDLVKIYDGKIEKIEGEDGYQKLKSKMDANEHWLKKTS